MRTYFQKNIDEIKADIVLKVTGCFLVLAHFITAQDWIQKNTARIFNTDYPFIACYPFFESCWKLSFFNYLNFNFIFWIYLALSLIASLLFFTRFINWAYSLSIFLLLIKIIIVFSRYNVMGNYHTMHFIACFCFLFLLQKRLIYIYTLCSFYFCAGLLKLNEEWMSGAALVSSPFLFKGPILVASLAYVIVLETLLIWGLLSKAKLIRITTFAQLFVFHLYSYFIVSYFYPAIMICLLSMVWIDFFIKNPSFSYNIRKLNKTNIVFFFLILLVNILPKIQYNDPSLDGKRRFLRFNMLDARTECNKIILIKSKNTIKNITVITPLESIRVHCDPVSYHAYISRMCTQLSKDQQLMVFIESKRTTGTSYTPVWETQNACLD